MSLLLFLVFFAFYLKGACPSLYGGDSGELIASAHLLGVAHAPGYPLYSLLAKAGQILIPFGNIAFRTNVVAAMTAPGVLLMTYFVILSGAQDLAFAGVFSGKDNGEILRSAQDDNSRTGSRLLQKFSAVSPILFLGLTPVFVEQARAAEVFGLNLLFMAAIVRCLFKAQRKNPAESRRWVVLAFLLLGLGLGNHHILLGFSPLLVMACWQDRGHVKFLLICLSFLIIGLSVYAYLPLRAAAETAVNFGFPDTWDRFWAVVTRKEFGSLSLHPAAVPFRNGDLITEHLLQFGERTIHQTGFIGLALIAVAFITGLAQKRSRRLTALLLLGFLIFGPVFEVVSNLSPQSDIGQWRLERFYLAPLWCAAVAVGLALHRLLNGSWFMKSISLVLLIGFVLTQVHAFPLSDFRRSFVFRDFGKSALQSAPANGSIIIDRVLFDEPTSALLVLTQVERKRPDLRFFYRPGTLFEAAYGKDILQLSWADRYERQRMVEQKLMQDGSASVRCLAFERGNTPFQKPVLDGLLYREASASAPDNTANIKSLYVNKTRPAGPSANYGAIDEISSERPSRFHAGDDIKFSKELIGKTDYQTRLMHAHFPYLWGKAAAEEGRIDQARNWFNSALAVGPDMAWLNSNIGGLYAQAGLLDEAERLFAQTVRNDFYFYEGHYGLGYVALKRQDFAKAVAEYETAIRMSPNRGEAYYMAGLAHAMSGQKDKARGPWEKYLQLDPSGPMAEAVRAELNP